MERSCSWVKEERRERASPGMSWRAALIYPKLLSLSLSLSLSLFSSPDQRRRRREGSKKRRVYSRSWSKELYTTMISGLCKEALLDEAEELLLQMGKDGCPPDDLTFNIVVRAFLKRGDTHKVKILLQEIINRKFSPDASTMSILVDLLPAEGEDSELLKMIQSLVPREDSKAVSQA